MAAGDFNGDGVLDLVTLNHETLGVLLGNGNGTFGLPVTTNLTSLSEPVLAVGDFNRDGTDDLAVGGAFYVSIFFGAGGGGFQEPVVYPLPGIVTSLAVGDFNGDDYPDVAAANWYGSLGYTFFLARVWLNRPDDPGTLEYGQDVNIMNGEGLEAGSVAAGDFDGNGYLDLALTFWIPPSSKFRLDSYYVIRIVPGVGNGVFGEPQDAFSVRLIRYAFPVVAGDYNRDGIDDLLLWTPREVAVLFGTADGWFTAVPDLYPAGSDLRGVTAGDFDGDGVLDFAAADIGGDTVGAFLGDGTGAFWLEGYYPVGRGPVGMAVGDFNGDGRADLAVANSGSQDVTVLLAWPGLVASPYGSPDAASAAHEGSRATALQPPTTSPMRTADTGRVPPSAARTLRRPGPELKWSSWGTAEDGKWRPRPGEAGPYATSFRMAIWLGAIGGRMES